MTTTKLLKISIMKTYKTVSLICEKVFEENRTSKYWRNVKCEPQEASINLWAINNPVFNLKGI